MKKKQVKAILSLQAERRKKIRYFIIAIIMVSLLAALSFYVYFNHNKAYYVTYSEKSNIDYKVYLKKNTFYENPYLGPGKEYVASLIDYINASFNYQLALDEKDVAYKYSYRIESNVDVKVRGTKKSLYSKTETLVDEVEKETNKNNVTINESLTLDYNYYNDLIIKFLDMYSLEGTESTLTINMYINVIGSCENFDENKAKESVMTLSIPLTTKTISIDISDDLIDTENNVMQCKKVTYGSGLYLSGGIILSLISVLLVVLSVRYEIKTRSAENIYEKELKKILNNYSSYIQTISNEFDFKAFKLVKVDNFTDMLEIRDTIKQPILMKESHDKTGAYFLIPSNTKILYIYRLKVSDIKKEMESENSIDIIG